MSGSLSIKNAKVVFGSQGYGELDRLLEKPWTRIFALTDENTAELCLPEFMGRLSSLRAFETIETKSGEQNKIPQTCVELWQKLAGLGADRKSLLINLGGGVICDMGAFAASCYMRGISFVNVPTTLLSQVDASVGGKTGVNLGGLKNTVGLFALPLLTLIDSGFCSTLSNQQVLSGFAEMIKHALIADKDYYRFLSSKNSFRNDELAGLIRRSVEIKQDIVERDFDEQGPRKSLNFGHTIGHAIETLFMGTEKQMSHGFAVAYGMAAEAALSGIAEAVEIKKYIFSRYPKPILSSEEADRLIETARSDKKNSGGKINFTLLSKIGACTWDNYIDEKIIKQTILDL